MKLRNYIKFDIKQFIADKQFLYLGTTDIYEYDEAGNRTNKIIGAKIETVIVKDGSGLNDYEKVNFKWLGHSTTEVEERFKKNDLVYPVKIHSAKVYGQYQNQLSIEAELETLSNIKAKQQSGK